MGQKVHPTSFRLGVTKNWKSQWFANKENYADTLIEDIKIREHITSSLTGAHISKIEIERASKRVRVIIHTGRPGMVIGRKGSQIELLKEKLSSIVGEEKQLLVDIQEIKNPVLDAKIVAGNIAFQLERRVAFRRAMKKTIELLKEAGGEGIKIACSGRLGGAEIARSESYKWGKIPLQTIRADIDYGYTESRTDYGVIGVKVWIYKGEKFDVSENEQEKKSAEKE